MLKLSLTRLTSAVEEYAASFNACLLEAAPIELRESSADCQAPGEAMKKRKGKRAFSLTFFLHRV